MPKRYETIAEVVQELRRRQFDTDENMVRRGMAMAALHTPMDNFDLLDLINALQLKRQDRYIERVSRTLESDEWRTSLEAAHRKIGIPSEGISEEQARALHVALLETMGGAPKTITIGIMTKPVLTMWSDVVREGRLLCRTLKIDPSDADNIHASFAAGSANWLIGVRKLLNPEGILKVGGHDVVYQSSAFDRLIGHLLWGLSLSPTDIVDRPSVKYRWERFPDGSGRCVEERFTPGQNTAAEDRALRKKLSQLKEIMRHNALLQVGLGEDLRDKPWHERWKVWMKVFPDFSYPSPDALRKAVARAMKKHSKSQGLEPSSRLLERHRAVTVPNEANLLDVNETDSIKILQLFNEKADNLEGLSVTKDLGVSGVTISGKRGQPIQAQRQGPDHKSIGAFVLAMRFFMPDNETALFRKMAGLYAEIPAGQDLVDKINDARTTINTELNKPSPIKFNDAELTYRAICEFFLWGRLADVDPNKKAVYDAWVQNPILLPLLQNEFIYALSMLSAMIFFMRDLNKVALSRLQKKP